MDDADRAQQLEQEQRQRALNEARKAYANYQHVTGSLRYCADCGGEISAARRSAAPFATCCTECQTYREK